MMYARSFFSHKALQGKKAEDLHEMLHGIGKNWATDLTDCEKNGTFLVRSAGEMRVREDIVASYEAINREIGHLF